jgi:hypothetical protein
VCACVREGGVGSGQEREGWGTENYTFGCLCKSLMKMIGEKVLNDRMSINQVDSVPGFINVQSVSCFNMVAFPVMYAIDMMSSVYPKEFPLSVICSAKFALLEDHVQSVFTPLSQHKCVLVS